MAKRPVDLPSDEEDDDGRRSPQASSSKKHKTNGHANGKGKQRASGVDEPDKDVAMKVEDEAFELAEREAMENDIEEHAGHGEIGAVAQMGIITKVVLDNFMNHTYLEVDLGPQINFLTGPNGSGKSALLTAITVALGAKATSTGRGTGMKAFIRDGQNVGRVTVHLKNKGPEAYRHDEYGDEIIVQRDFHRTGSATYKIQSTKKGRNNLRTVSTKRDELNRILDHMNIQVDNPINVLSQDAAKAFLAKSGEKEKYDFFLKGTSLAQLSEEYDLVKNNIDSIAAALKNKEDALPDMKERVMEAKKKVESVQAGAVLERKLQDAQGESAWSMVIGKEGERDQAKLNVESKIKKARKIQKELDKAKAEEENFKSEVAAHEDEIRALKEAMLPAQEELKAATDQFKAAKVDLRSNDAEQREMKAAIEALKAEIDHYTAEIEKENARLAVDNSAEKRERQDEIDRLTESVNKTEAQKPILQGKLVALRAKRDDLANQLDELNRKIDDHDRLTANIAGRKQQLEQSRGGGPLAPYGRRMDVLMQTIDRTRWRGEKPLGPLGVGVKLRDVRYQDVIHTQLGGLLSSFAVTHPDDAKQLRVIFRDLKNRSGLGFPGNKDPGIIIYRPDPRLDISSGDLSLRGYTTLLSLLDIPNVHVRNLLVDRASAERTPVFETRREASDEAQKLGEGATTVSMKPLYKITVKGGTVSANFPTNWTAPGLFVANHEAEIRTVTEELANMKRRKEELVAQRKGLEEEAVVVNQETRRLAAELDEQSNDIARYKSSIAALIEQNRDQDPPNIAAFHEMITEKTDEKQNLEAQLRDSEAAKATKLAEASPLAATHAELTARLKDDKDKQRQLEDAMVDKAKKMVKATSDVQHWENQTNPAEVAVAQAESDLETLESEVVDWTATCSAVHAVRIETSRTEAQINGDIKGLERAIREARKDTGISFEDAQEQLERSSTAFKNAKQEVKDMKALNDSLTAALKIRGEKWHHFRRYIALRSKLLFTKNLEVRGFFGKLLFDHVNGLLKVKIQTDERAGGDSRANDKDPNQLSGGEKSFSTVALLLSFWDAVGCPIRCLDEFDVFMDAINRRQTLTMMIDTAKATDNTQFILISPQDTSSVRTGEAVKIIQMWDPKRYEKGARARVD